MPASYILTPKITRFLQSIEASREVIETIKIPTEVEINIRRASILKSSLFSARIEGNPLTLGEITGHSSKDQRKHEVFNILQASELVRDHRFKDISKTLILQLHQKVMEGLSDKETLGSFRKEANAIFSTAGIAIYLPPPPKQVPTLLEKLVKFANSPKELFIPIKACLVHYSFEKIHPFLDGNGRVGRLLLQAALEKGGYGMKGLLALEEFLDTHRTSYYDALEETQRDVTGYLEFMLEAIADASQKAKQLVLEKRTARVEDYLLPRRAEIYNIIKDHQLVNFDMIRRRFMAVNQRTLRYDLKKLQDAGLIKKRGMTKGVYYEIKNEN